jgi:hypothetical protein
VSTRTFTTFGLVFVEDDDLRDVALHVVERRQEHVLRLHALRVDVLVADVLEDLVHDLELRQVVVGGRVGARPVVRGDRGGEAIPQAVPLELEGEPARNSEGDEEREELERAGEETHWFEYRPCVS